MATGSEAAKPAEAVLEWHKQDSKRMLHAVYRVGDLDRTIKYYTECFGMKLLRKRDVPDEKYTNAFLGFGPEDTNFALELTYNYGVDKYDSGEGFGHFGIANEDVYRLAEHIKSKGGNIIREPGPVKGGSTVISFAQDPDGYRFALIQRALHEPLCQVMLRVGDLERSIKFYEKALGMKLLTKTYVPDYKYTIAKLGYAEEEKTTVLELIYNYGVTEYSKGNAYAQIAIGTNDVYKSAEAVDLATKEVARFCGSQGRYLLSTLRSPLLLIQMAGKWFWLTTLTSSRNSSEDRDAQEVADLSITSLLVLSKAIPRF